MEKSSGKSNWKTNFKKKIGKKKKIPGHFLKLKVAWRISALQQELLSTQKCVFLSVINEKAGVCVCKHVFTRVFTFEFGRLTHRFQDLKVRHPHQEKILMMKTMNCSVYSTYIITTTLIYSTYKYRATKSWLGVRMVLRDTQSRQENYFPVSNAHSSTYLSRACSTFLSCLSQTHWQSHRYVCKRECVKNIIKRVTWLLISHLW